MGKIKYNNLDGQDIGIYKILYECDHKSKDGRRVFYVRCNECGWEGEQNIKNILSSKKCTHTFVEPDINTELGIYKNIRPSGNKGLDGRHTLYYADCKICGKTVERTLYDLRHFNTICQHGNGFGKNISTNLDIISPIKDYSNEDHQYYKRVYDLWRSMLLRTTLPFWEKHPTYEGTTVSSDWLSFDTFYEDIKILPNYEQWKNSYGERMMLDKDVLGNGKKLYSKETCCFLTHAESNRDVLSRHPEMIKRLIVEGSKAGKEKGRKVKATNKKTKEERIFNSIKECSKELNIQSSHIWMCLSKEEKYKSHKSSKGWTFEEIF